MNNPILSLASLSARILPLPVKRALYRFPLLAGLIRGGLNRAAPQGLVQVTIAAGGAKGFQMILDMQSEKDYWLGTYEPELQAAVRDWVKPGVVAYDVGANIGYTSFLLARAVKESGRVYAFEALPENLERLQANLALNRLESMITVIPVAVVDRTGTVQFMVGPSGGMSKAEGSSGRQKAAYANTITVSGIALDDFVYQEGKPTPSMIKMDIEGGEVLAVPGMERILTEARPLVLLELHGPEAARVVWEIFTGIGYRIFRMKPGYPEVLRLDALEWKSYLVARPVK